MTLEVIGAGFGRTGTNSLRTALEILGFAPCHHMFELRENEDQLAIWERIAAGDRPAWESVFAGYRAQVDWPGVRFWRELAAAYPHAPVVLTLREPQEWYDSVQATIWPFMRDTESHATEFVRRRARLANRLIVDQVFSRRLGDRTHAISVYEAHIDAVRREIAGPRLLEYRLSDGWEPLCWHLGVPVPDAPMPHSNSRAVYDPTAPGRPRGQAGA